MNKISVTVSLDPEHDSDLYALLVAQSEAPGAGFSVAGCSETFTATDVWTARARRRIHRADQLIVICGEHTDDSMSVFSEVRIAQEEGTPYFLLWGRRETMCTKPAGAKPAEGIYGWTPEIIEEQIALIGRAAQRQAAARALKRPGRQQNGDGAAPS